MAIDSSGNYTAITGEEGWNTSYRDNPLMEAGDPGMQFLDQSFGAGKNASKNKMADIAASQMQISAEQWSMYKNVFAPYEAELVAAHRQIIPEQTALDLSSISAQQEGITRRSESLDRSLGVEEAFYDQAQQGMNVQDRMNAAQADVQQGYDVSQPQMMRDASRLGLQPGSGKFTDAMAKMAYSRAKDIGFARTNARRTTEEGNFARLGQGMQMRGQTAGFTTGNTNPLGQGMAGIGLQKAGQSFGGMADASSSYSEAAKAQAGTTQSAVSAGSALLTAFSDERLKTNINIIGYKHGLPWYSWVWNRLATKLFGLVGVDVGHMAHEVELKYPELVTLVDGYKTVNYGGLK